MRPSVPFCVRRSPESDHSVWHSAARVRALNSQCIPARLSRVPMATLHPAPPQRPRKYTSLAHRTPDSACGVAWSGNSGATASVLGAGHLATGGGEWRPEFSGVEFFLPAFRPLSSPWAVGLFRDRSSAAGRESVNDLSGIRKLIVGDIPDPGRPIPEHHPTRHLAETGRVVSRQIRWAKETVRRRYLRQKHFSRTAE